MTVVLRELIITGFFSCVFIEQMYDLNFSDSGTLYISAAIV